MQSLLYLVHRIPYPPNKGDKIRSFHLLQFLSKSHRVFLGAFVDDTEDWKYAEVLHAMCEKVYLCPLNPTRSKLRSMKGFLTGEAMTIPYYRDTKMQNWVNEIIDTEGINQVIVFSSAMAQYIQDERYHHLYKIIDFVDMDSDKWRQYCTSKNWPLKWLYWREAETLLQYEQAIAREFSISLFVSRQEAKLFKEHVPDVANKVSYYNNGVDTEYFDPDREYLNPYSSDELVIVFTGAMDYWANVDAVNWFSREVYPEIRKNIPMARFYIVGSNPSKHVLRLAHEDGIVVTGRVSDVRPYIAWAELSVAPLRIARGLQNKVLEAMAMARPVLSTSGAAEGIDIRSGRELFIADNTQEFINIASQILRGQTGKNIGQVARKYILENFNWENNLSTLAETFAMTDV